jgi:hypothetical protein
VNVCHGQEANHRPDTDRITGWFEVAHEKLALMFRQWRNVQNDHPGRAMS